MKHCVTISSYVSDTGEVDTRTICEGMAPWESWVLVIAAVWLTLIVTYIAIRVARRNR